MGLRPAEGNEDAASSVGQVSDLPGLGAEGRSETCPTSSTEWLGLARKDPGTAELSLTASPRLRPVLDLAKIVN